MATAPDQTLKQRTTKDEAPTSTTNKGGGSNKRENKKMAMAKRGLRSLSIAIAVPLALSFFTASFSSAGHKYNELGQKPFWFPPLWALHAACMGKSVLMGLSAWLVWAEGGFHRQPNSVPLFVGSLLLSMLWDLVVFAMGSPGTGLVICMALFGTLLGCYKTFRSVNPIAGDLVKPCLAWVAYLTLVNFKLLHI